MCRLDRWSCRLDCGRHRYQPQKSPYRRSEFEANPISQIDQRLGRLAIELQTTKHVPYETPLPTVRRKRRTPHGIWIESRDAITRRSSESRMTMTRICRLCGVRRHQNRIAASKLLVAFIRSISIGRFSEQGGSLVSLSALAHRRRATPRRASAPC